MANINQLLYLKFYMQSYKKCTSFYDEKLCCVLKNVANQKAHNSNISQNEFIPNEIFPKHLEYWLIST